jgi:hypothetical protein
VLDPKALVVVQAAIDLSATHQHAPAIDVLDLVIMGSVAELNDFNDQASSNASLSALGAPLGELEVVLSLLRRDRQTQQRSSA